MTFIGIDPGKAGGIAVIDGYDGSVSLAVFSEENYRNAVENAVIDNGGNPNDIFAVVEKVHAMPGQGVTSMFSFGHNLGWIEGLLYGRSIPYQLVSPQTWKKSFGLSFAKGTDKRMIKDASIRVAHQLFPSVSLKATERCKVDHDGLSEALLMAEYGRRMYRK